MPDDEVQYWQEFKEGAYESAKSKNSAIELNVIDSSELSAETIELLEIATISQLDGVIVVGTNTIEQDEAINRAMEADMKVVVVGQETTTSNVYSYVGTNYYEYGAQAAKLITQLSNEIEEGMRIGVFLSNESGSGEKIVTSQNDILLNGIKSVIEVEENIDIELVTMKDRDMISAEENIRDMLSDEADINVIFCINEKDTESAARVIIERNLVGKVYVIGAGVTESITNYLEKGIVYGTIDRNGYEAGMKSVEVLTSSFGYEHIQPDYIDIDIDTYTSVNIRTYEDK